MTTINELPGSLLNNPKKQELIANLEDAVTNIFPQVDSIYFYTNFKRLLYKNIFDPPAETPSISELYEKIKEEDSQLPGFETGETGLDPIPTPKTQRRNRDGIKQIIDKYITSSKLPNPSDSIAVNKFKADLESELVNTLNASLEVSFNDLVDQGAQGALLNATYDRQIITRISDYTTTLLDELNSDLNKEIPDNQTLSLDAAKEVTAAAISFRFFAEKLMSVVTTFNDEGDPTGSKGTNYEEIRNILEGPSKLPDKLNFIDLANALYAGNGQPEPLIKQAELYGVKLAANAAGLGTSLNKLLKAEQTDTINALKTLKDNATSNYSASYTQFDKKAKTYFTNLDKYISAKQQFEFDQNRLTILQDSMDDLTNYIVQGIDQFDQDSDATIN